MSIKVLVYSLTQGEVWAVRPLVCPNGCFHIYMLVNDAVLDFLPTQEVARMALVSRAHWLLLREKKSVLRSVWNGDLPASHRPLFWLSHLPISE